MLINNLAKKMRLIEKVWFQGHFAKWLMVPLLLPLMLIFAVISFCRRIAFKLGLLKSFKVSVPVVVVGNIGIGGNGKTPVTLYLVEQLTAKGLKVGVVSRGYGSKAPYYPYQVNEESSAEQAGDEPLLIFQRSGIPVVIGADRVKGCQQLIDQGCEIIIADDGLQHYGLERDIEICVFDGERKWGNGCLLPVGPLRESLSRVKSIDFIVVNGESWQDQALFRSAIRMDLQGGELKSLGTGETKTISHFQAQRVNAVAAIGNPERFFQALEAQGLSIQRHGFNDHHAYSESDLDFENDLPIIMTEKDAVKCRSFKLQNAWYLPVSAKLSNDLASQIISALKHKGF